MYLLFWGNCQEFEDYKDADDAVYEMNHKEFMGERYDQFIENIFSFSAFSVFSVRIPCFTAYYTLYERHVP